MSWNEGFLYRERLEDVPPRTTAVTYLSGRWPHSSREEWRRRVEAGRVRVNEKAIAPDGEVRSGDLLEWHRPPWLEADVPLSFAVLHRDEHVLAVAKPAGLPTLPGGGFLNHTLLAQVRARFPDASPVHRLGRWTSGVVLFGRTSEARARLTRAWRGRDVIKEYRALASGIPGRSEFAVDVAIGPVPYAPLGTLHAACAEGKPARTRFRVLEVRDGCFLAEAFLETGRPHQIRIHLAAAGHPLVGDPLYVEGGKPRPGERALPGDPGYSLHASRLALAHPVSGEQLVIECAPPALLDLRSSDTRSLPVGSGVTPRAIPASPPTPACGAEAGSARSSAPSASRRSRRRRRPG